MSRPRKPTWLLEDKGAFRKDPARGRSRHAALEGFIPLGEPPKHFKRRETAAWNEIRLKAPSRTLAEGDFMLVELAARLLVKSRYDWPNFTATDSRVLQSIANDLGMSPVRRGRVSPAKAPKAEGTFLKLAAALSGSTQPN